MSSDRHKTSSQTRKTTQTSKKVERDLGSLPPSAIKVPMPPVKPPKGSGSTLASRLSLYLSYSGCVVLISPIKPTIIPKRPRIIRLV
jgi:hypothetical protein